MLTVKGCVAVDDADRFGINLGWFYTFPYAQLVNLNRGRHFGVNVSYSF